MRLNLGIVRPMSTPTTADTAITATPMVHSSPVEVASTRSTATTPMMGAMSTRRMNMVAAIWTCWTSLVQRVMSEAWLKRFTSAGEKRITWSNAWRRRSRAMVAAVCDAMAPMNTVAARLTRHRPNIVAAVRVR